MSSELMQVGPMHTASKMQQLWREAARVVTLSNGVTGNVWEQQHGGELSPLAARVLVRGVVDPEDDKIR